MRGYRPSRTAVKIGKGMAYLARDPRLRALLPEGAVACSERLMTAAGLMKPWELSVFRSGWFHRYVTFIERHTMPGTLLYMILRKRYLDDETRRGIAEGARQVLVVGAGFDTLCVRLAEEYPEVTFVEIDHPGTHEAKRAGVEGMGASARNLHLIGADLGSCSLEEVLGRAGVWRREALSVVVAEGVLMYLEERSVSALLAGVRAMTGMGSRLVFTCVRTDESGRIRFGKLGRLSLISLKIMGEPLRWGVREGELEGFLSGHGYRLGPLCDLAGRYLAPAGLGEMSVGDVEFPALARTVDD